MNKNEKGFSFVELLVILVVVGLVAGSGYYVWKKNQNKPAKQTETTTQQKTEEQEPAATINEDSETTNWREIKSAEYGFSYKYPSDPNWQADIVKEEVGSELYARGQRINVADAGYKGCGKNCGLAFQLQLFEKGSNADVGIDFVENVQMKGSEPYWKLSSKTVANRDNVSGTRWEYVPSGNESSRTVFYYFTKDNYAYFFQINSNGAKTDKIDITEQGEKIFSTFKFSN